MPNPFAQAQFALSCAALTQLPADSVTEVAFVGRSNAGKSSALNAICGKRALARVSKTPGRTQLINLFEVGTTMRLVDLPGYGFAQVPEPMRRRWGELVGGYVEKRANLRGIIVIMDIRHPLTRDDQQMLEWIAGSQRGCVILLTKADKLGFGASKQQWLQVSRAVEPLLPDAKVQLFSAHAPSGVEETREHLLALFQRAEAPDQPTDAG